MLEKACRWWPIWYLLFCSHGSEGQLQWVVKEKVTAYGQNLILFCLVENCCSEPAGWFVGPKSIILDVKTFSNDPKAKYHGTYNTDGFGVVIRNLSAADLNVTYRCVYGFDQSTPNYLLHVDVFSENVPYKDTEIDTTAIVVAIVVIMVGVIIGMAYSVYISRIKKKRQKQPENVKDDLLKTLVRRHIISGNDGLRSMALPYESSEDEILNDAKEESLEPPGNDGLRSMALPYESSEDEILNGNHVLRAMALPYESSEDEILNEHAEDVPLEPIDAKEESLEPPVRGYTILDAKEEWLEPPVRGYTILGNDVLRSMALPYRFSEDEILNDDNDNDNSLTNEKVPYQSPQNIIPNVTDRQQVIDYTFDDASHSCEVEVVTRDTSQTYVKVPYSSHGSSIDSAVRGVIPSRDEDNLNQQDRSFSPLSGGDRSCQGAVGGGIDDNDTPSSINNVNDVNLLIDQPEHNSQPGRIVLGLQSFDLPVQNPNANLPHHLPQNHGGSSDEDDSGFQN